MIIQSSYNLLFDYYGNIPAVGQVESKYVDSTISIFHEEKNLDIFRFIEQII